MGSLSLSACFALILTKAIMHSTGAPPLSLCPPSERSPFLPSLCSRARQGNFPNGAAASTHMHACAASSRARTHERARAGGLRAGKPGAAAAQVGDHSVVMGRRKTDRQAEKGKRAPGQAQTD